MFIDELSRFRCAELIRTDDGYLHWDLRRTLEYLGHEDDIAHEVQPDDTWHSLAYKFYGTEFGGANLWWVIADYQPEPVLDPTVLPTPGDIVMIPAPSIIQDFILSVNDEDSFATN